MSDYASRLPIRTEVDGDVVVKIGDGTTPSQYLAIDAAGLIGSKLYDGAGTAITSQANGGQRALDVGIDVAGVQVDPRSIRALTSSDVVTANQGAPNTAANGWPVKPTDGTNSQSYTAAGEAKVSVTQPLPAGTNIIGIVNARLDDGAGNAITSQTNGAQRALDVGINVAGVQIDPRQIRALTSADVVTANIKDSAGASITNGQKTMANSVPVVIASDQSAIPVTITNTVVGTVVNKYNTTSALAAAASVNHDYAVTATKTLYTKKFWAAASGKIKAEVQTSPDGTTFTSFWVGFNSTANPCITIDLNELVITVTGTGSKARIIITNLDKAAMDVYSTISGNEQ